MGGPIVLVASLLTIGSVLTASHPAMAAREVALLACCACIALAIACGNAGRRDLIVTAVFASATYVAVLLLIAIGASLSGLSISRSELPVGYDNYRFYNHVQTVALPLAVLAGALVADIAWLRRIAWLGTVGGFALLIATAGRGTALGILVAGFVAWVCFGRVASRLVATLALGAAGGMIICFVLFVGLPVLTGAPVDGTEQYYGVRHDSGRFYLWQLAVDYVRESPWLGIGPMHYASRPNLKAAHPHNLYLQVAAEWGLPMLILMLGVVADGFRRIVRAVRECTDERLRTEGVGLFIVCVAIAVDAGFSGNFVMPVPQVWIAFAIGWTLAWYRAVTPTAAPTVISAKAGAAAWALAVAAIGSQVWLVWHVWPEMTNLEAHLSAVTEKVANPRTNPRFWSHGWF
jgi:O-antigen ligase